MKILLLGSGGRESALAYKISQSKHVKKLYVAPGNAQTGLLYENVDLNVTDFVKIGNFCIENDIDMVIVGPEEPLVKGIVDFFETHGEFKGIKIVGPNMKGAKLEGSKDFAKNFMAKFNIPTAKYKTFNLTSINEGYAFIDSLTPPFVLKADGLAAGKGVVIVNDKCSAKTELKDMIEGMKFGDASANVVIEEFLNGIELSVFVFTDGNEYKILPVAKDYKKIGENDSGPNTGGMGSVSPVSFADDLFMSKIEERIIKPTIYGLNEEGIKYNGFIFFGLINVNGEPFVIEYNCRMGDPETESVIPRIKSDMVEMFLAAFDGSLKNYYLDISPEYVVSIMMVSGGYPEKYEKGKKIYGLDKDRKSLVFHAGTILKNNEVYTNGGRVLTVTSFGENLQKALNCAYNDIRGINFDDSYYRNDIGFDLE